jgi:hypothetical protein
MCLNVPTDELGLRQVIVVHEQKERAPRHPRTAVPCIGSALPLDLKKPNPGADRCKVLARGWLMTVTLVNNYDFKRGICLRL